MSDWTDQPHEHDAEGNCIEPGGQEGFYAQGLPTWKFSVWDVAGVVSTTAGGLFLVLGQGLNLLSRECAAMANWRRQNYDLKIAERQRKAAVEAYEAHQREMAEALSRFIEGPAAEEES